MKNLKKQKGKKELNVEYLSFVDKLEMTIFYFHHKRNS